LGYLDKKQKQKNWPACAGRLKLAKTGNFGLLRLASSEASQKINNLSLLAGPDQSGLASSNNGLGAVNSTISFRETFCFFVETFFCYYFVWS
jgi:hypothetical protein